jgi:DNA-binding LacI/PurR family transcriptional regulator
LPILELPLIHAPSEPDDTEAKFEVTVRHKMKYLAEYLGNGKGCDAILDSSDGEVPATAAACRKLGYEPNLDVLIAGYDNYWSDVHERMFELAGPIVTMDKLNWQMGMEMVNLLLARAEGRLKTEPQLRWITPALVPYPGQEKGNAALRRGVGREPGGLVISLQ